MTPAAQFWAFLPADVLSWRPAIPAAAIHFLGIWGVLSAWASFRFADLLADSSLRRAWQAVFFLAMLPLPLADELLARRQFDAVCNQRAELTLHVGAARTAYWQLDHATSEALPGLWLPMQVHRQSWRDRSTGALVAELTFVQAGGGRLARMAQRPAEPLTFQGDCRPQAWAALSAPRAAPFGTGALPQP